MLLIIDAASAQVLARYTHWTGDQAGTDRAVALTAANHGLSPDALTAYLVEDAGLAEQLDRADLANIQVTVESGQVTGVSVAPPNNVWLHITMTGGDGDTPIGVANSGTEERELTAAITVRAAQDAASQILPLTGRWRIRFRRDTGEIYAIRRVQITDGQASIPFSVVDNAPEGELYIDESDFEPVEVGGTTYVVRLASPVKIVVFKP